MDWILPGSSGPGLFPGRILEWVSIYHSSGSSPPRSSPCLLGLLLADSLPLLPPCLSSILKVRVLVAQSWPALLGPHGLQPVRLLCSRDSPGRNTGVGSHSLRQWIFPIQGSNSCLLHCKQILYYLSHQGIHYRPIQWKKFFKENKEIESETRPSQRPGHLSLPPLLVLASLHVVVSIPQRTSPWLSKNRTAMFSGILKSSPRSQRLLAED